MLFTVEPENRQTQASLEVKANGLGKLKWDSTAGADAYIIVRDGKQITVPIRIEGSNKIWTDHVQ